MQVVSPGKLMTSSLVAPDVSVQLGDYKFLSSPIVLGYLDQVHDPTLGTQPHQHPQTSVSIESAWQHNQDEPCA